MKLIVNHRTALTRGVYLVAQQVQQDLEVLSILVVLVTQTLFVPEDHVLPVVPVLQVILLVQKDPERQRIPEIRSLPLGLEDLLALKQ